MASGFDMIAPAKYGWVPALSDTVDLPKETRALLIPSDEDGLIVKCLMYDPDTGNLAAVSLPVVAGYNPIATTRIYSTGTTATGVIAIA
jgi:hypothetical protein